MGSKKAFLEKGKKFNIQSLGFNTKYSDFGGTLKDGKLYITSARNTSRKTKIARWFYNLKPQQ